MYDHLFKILIVGPTKVGKTWLAKKYAGDQPVKNFYEPSIGMDHVGDTIINIPPKHCKLDIRVGAGDNKYQPIVSAYYRGATAIILCYDITSQESFAKLNSFLQPIEIYTVNPIVYLVGTKCDLEEIRVIPRETAENFVNENKLAGYMEVSAKENINVATLFETVAKKALQKVAPTEEIKPKTWADVKKGLTDEMTRLTAPKSWFERLFFDDGAQKAQAIQALITKIDALLIDSIETQEKVDLTLQITFWKNEPSKADEKITNNALILTPRWSPFWETSPTTTTTAKNIQNIEKENLQLEFTPATFPS